MAETIGTLADRIAITDLKIYHMKEQVDRPDAAPEHKRACTARVKILTEQKDDLVEELNILYREVVEGKKKLKVYRQFKMYNDPTYRVKKG